MFPWDDAHARGNVPVAVTYATVCDAKGGTCETGPTIAYDTPTGPKARGPLDPRDPSVAAAVARFKASHRGDSTPVNEPARCRCPRPASAVRVPAGRPGMPSGYAEQRAQDFLSPLTLTKERK